MLDCQNANPPQVDSPSGGQLALKVNGVARIPASQSLYGSVLNILTVGGTIIVDGTLITFEEVGPSWEPTAPNAPTTSGQFGEIDKLMMMM